MSLYIQRQLSTFLVPGGGATLTPSSVSFADDVQELSDTYPGNILSVGTGNSSTGDITLAASATQVLSLPVGYTSTHYLGILLACSQTVKAVIVSPDHATGTHLIKAGLAAEGFFSSQDSVTSLTITNTAATATTVRYFLWTYPLDLSDATAWRSGTQTTGVL